MRASTMLPIILAGLLLMNLYPHMHSGTFIGLVILTAGGVVLLRELLALNGSAIEARKQHPTSPPQRRAAPITGNSLNTVSSEAGSRVRVERQADGN